MKLPSHYRRWTPEEDALLDQLLDEGLPYKVIGLRMERERHAIEKRRTKLGLKSLRQRGGAVAERAAVVAWLKLSADQILGGALTGGYHEDKCELSAELLERAAQAIENGEHLK